MRRLIALMSMFMLLGAGLVTVASAARAQDETSLTEGHPLVGGWYVDAEAENPDNPVEIVLIHDDGTVVNVALDEEGGGQEVVLGVWQSTGERTADITLSNTVPIGAGVFGTVIVRVSLEASEDGSSFSGQYTFEFSGLPGAEGEYGPETVTGTRIAVEPMGTPVGPVSDLFALFEGTPEATPSS